MGVRNSSGVRTEDRDGRKILIIDFRWKDKAGRVHRYRKDASVQQRGAALAEAQRLMKLAVERGSLDPEPESPTLSEFVTGKFEELVMPGFRPATKERYRRLLEQEGIVDLLGKKRMDAIGVQEHRALHASIVERNVDPRPHLALLRTLLREAHDLGLIKEMPRLPPLPPKQRKLPSAPPLVIVRALLQESEGWLRTAIALAYFVSMRSGEVRAARVMDVDFIAGIIFTRTAFSADVVVTPKSGDERAAPMAAPLRPILEDAARGKKPKDRLVTDKEGKTPSRQKLYKAFIALQTRLGISPAWSFHKLRHAFGTHLVQLGANIEAVREMMGHADLAMTSRYLHATSGDKVHAIGLLAGNYGETKH